MRFFKKLGKFMIFLFVVFLIGIIGIKIYIKLSPKVEINSTNSVFLYDKDEDVFFQGNESSSWISLDDISQYVIAICAVKSLPRFTCVESSISKNIGKSKSVQPVLFK